jgi:hypothetical protein
MSDDPMRTFGDAPDDRNPMPHHERDDEQSLGGGVAGAGGTATDLGSSGRGDSALGAGADDDTGDPVDDDGEVTLDEVTLDPAHRDDL